MSYADMLRQAGVPNKNDPATYDAAFIQNRVRSGKDKERAQTLDALAAKATQPPHDDDAQALQQLQLAAGVADPNQGMATMDAKNYGRMLLAEIGGGQYDYGKAHDGGGFVGSLGGVLKTVAPFAGLIPGIGIPLGAIAAAGGSALGGQMHGDKFNLGKTLLAGGAGAAGAAWNPFGAKLPAAPDMTGAFGSGAAPIGPPPPLTAPSIPGAAAVSGGGGNILKSMFGNGQGGVDWTKLIGAGATIAGGANAASTQHQANQQRDQAISGATNNWNQRQPLRDAAQTGLLGLDNVQRPDLSSMFADAGNPFARKPAPLTPGMG